MLQHSPEKLSGGFQVRLNLAKVLVSEPNLLLLDEPTNYLDIVSMRWLKRFLCAWRGEMILDYPLSGVHGPGDDPYHGDSSLQVAQGGRYDPQGLRAD